MMNDDVYVGVHHDVGSMSSMTSPATLSLMIDLAPTDHQEFESEVNPKG